MTCACRDSWVVGHEAASPAHESAEAESVRVWLTKALGWIEDIVYVGLVLLLTADLPHMLEKADPLLFRQVTIELALLALLIVALVASLVLLRRRPTGAIASVRE